MYNALLSVILTILLGLPSHLQAGPFGAAEEPELNKAVVLDITSESCLVSSRNIEKVFLTSELHQGYPLSDGEHQVVPFESNPGSHFSFRTENLDVLLLKKGGDVKKLLFSRLKAGSGIIAYNPADGHASSDAKEPCINPGEYRIIVESDISKQSPCPTDSTIEDDMLSLILISVKQDIVRDDPEEPGQAGGTGGYFDDGFDPYPNQPALSGTLSYPGLTAWGRQMN